MSVDELLPQLLGDDTTQLTPIFRHWLSTSRRFRTFAAHYQTKIRAKLRGAGDEEALHDLLFELEIARWLLQEKRFHLAYELHGVRTAAGPDFTVTFTTKAHFYVEVTRIHTTALEESTPAEAAVDSSQRKLFTVILGKLYQLKAGAPNLLLIGVAPLAAVDELDEIMKQMKQRVEKNDLSLLARSRLPTPAAFLKQYQALSGILCYFLPTPATPPPPPLFWLNKAASYPLVTQVQTILRQLSYSE